MGHVTEGDVDPGGISWGGLSFARGMTGVSGLCGPARALAEGTRIDSNWAARSPLSGGTLLYSTLLITLRILGGSACISVC